MRPVSAENASRKAESTWSTYTFALARSARLAIREISAFTLDGPSERSLAGKPALTRTSVLRSAIAATPSTTAPIPPSDWRARIVASLSMVWAAISISP
jgi:hypothetical protein